MDARELLRRYLEQRRDMGEQELVLDRMDVDEVLRIVGALRSGAPGDPDTPGAVRAAGAAPQRRTEPPPARRVEGAPDARPERPEQPERTERTEGRPDAGSGGADFDWRAALRAAGGAPDSAVSKPAAMREERPAAEAEATRSAAPGTSGAGAEAGPHPGDEMAARKASKSAKSATTETTKTAAARTAAARTAARGDGGGAQGGAKEQELPSWLRGLDVPIGLVVGGRVTELTDEHFTRLPTIDAVAKAVHDCTRCPLYKTATHGVPGEGSPDAELVCVGEAPGAQEDETGRPFVGASGQLLTKILAAIKLSREEVFICNVLKHRPPGNRNPAPDEVEACSPYLLRQLELVKPKVIVTFGTFAAQTLLRTKTPIGKLREQVHLYHGIPLVVTYHPAALLRNPAWKRPTWNDVQLARRILDHATDA